MSACAVCYGEHWVKITHFEGSCTYYTCPACCHFPPLPRPWPWEEEAGAE